MKHATSLPESHKEVLLRICPLIMANGIKSTTMDDLAAELRMSKRTLYEMFQSKDQMVEEALKMIHSVRKAQLAETNVGSGNVMVALMRGINLQRMWLNNTSVEFLRDLDRIFTKPTTDAGKEREDFYRDFSGFLRKGIEEGYIREDINPDVQCRVVALQMESLKRMEAFFPPHITLIEAFDCISLGIVRGMATPKGLEVIDSMHMEAASKKQSPFESLLGSSRKGSAKKNKQ